MSVVATYTQAQVDAKLAELSASIAENAARSAQITTDSDQGWIVICGALVFFMQIGFGMLEAGAISKKNVQNILYKNFLDASGAAICYWLLGYGFAYGETVGGFIGNVSGKSVPSFAGILSGPQLGPMRCASTSTRSNTRNIARPNIEVSEAEIGVGAGEGADAGKWRGRLHVEIQRCQK
jgi:hypothetical protein